MPRETRWTTSALRRPVWPCVSIVVFTFNLHLTNSVLSYSINKIRLLITGLHSFYFMSILAYFVASCIYVQPLWQALSKGGPMHTVLKVLSTALLLQGTSVLLNYIHMARWDTCLHINVKRYYGTSRWAFVCSPGTLEMGWGRLWRAASRSVSLINKWTHNNLLHHHFWTFSHLCVLVCDMIAQVQMVYMLLSLCVGWSLSRSRKSLSKSLQWDSSPASTGVALATVITQVSLWSSQPMIHTTHGRWETVRTWNRLPLYQSLKLSIRILSWFYFSLRWSWYVCFV